MCKCRILEECEETLPNRGEFVKGFKKLDSSSRLWAELFQCETCGQHWIVEVGGEMDRRTDKAFKITEPKNWLSYDTMPALAGWLIKKHGGLSEKQCIFSGCNEKALKNMAVCIYHGHSEYNWGKTI